MKKQIVIAALNENLSWVPESWVPITLVYRCGVEEIHTEKPDFNSHHSHMGGLRTGHNDDIVSQAERVRKVYDSLTRILFSEKAGTRFLSTRGGKASVETTNDPNGREAAQWLRHIIWNYDRLADVTCFLQGHPFDHCQNIIKEVEDANGYGTFPTSVSGSIGGDDLKLVEAFWVENMKLPFDGLVQWSAGAQFYASRKLIHTQPLSFYEKLANCVLVTSRSGEIMERLWLKILSTPCAE